ncbi:MAG: phosphoribosylamine--glycine ligase [Methylocystaceae bacterium]
MKKKVLVIGSGGREHALAWKLGQSPQVEKVFAAPGNPGIAEVAELVPIAVDNIDGLLDFARREQIDLTVVGPELPLTLGIVNIFRAAGLVIFGPTREAAALEGSKVFAKRLMEDAGIPTAQYAAFDSYELAADYIRSAYADNRPVVVKADGLAAGKGVIIPENVEEALAALKEVMLEGQVGDAGKQVVLEERLTGEEVSVFAISDGEEFVYLISAQDHKRVYDSDNGPNTGGMGAYTNPPIYTPAVHEQALREVLAPTVQTMKAKGIPYTGVIYAGLMLTPRGIRVLEYNARFGDPECQVIMALMASDLYELLYSASTGSLAQVKVAFSSEEAVCVVMAASGYPSSPRQGDKITVGQFPEGVRVFHAGTAYRDGELVTSGGRVLNVVATAANLQQAVDKVYRAIPNINFAGAHYRRDIAYRAL